MNAAEAARIDLGRRTRLDRSIARRELPKEAEDEAGGYGTRRTGRNKDLLREAGAFIDQLDGLRMLGRPFMNGRNDGEELVINHRGAILRCAEEIGERAHCKPQRKMVAF